MFLICYVLSVDPSVISVMYLTYKFIERGKAVCIEDIFNAKLV